MQLFKLEAYLTRYEFSAPHLFCCSDAEAFSVAEVLALANSEEKALWETLSLQYTEPFGLPSLRSTIADSMYQNMQADNILCFAGAEEGIYCALSVLLSLFEAVM